MRMKIRKKRSTKEQGAKKAKKTQPAYNWRVWGRKTKLWSQSKYLNYNQVNKRIFPEIKEYLNLYIERTTIYLGKLTQNYSNHLLDLSSKTIIFWRPKKSSGPSGKWSDYLWGQKFRLTSDCQEQRTKYGHSEVEFSRNSKTEVQVENFILNQALLQVSKL